MLPHLRRMRQPLVRHCSSSTTFATGLRHWFSKQDRLTKYTVVVVGVVVVQNVCSLLSTTRPQHEHPRKTHATKADKKKAELPTSDIPKSSTDFSAAGSITTNIHDVGEEVHTMVTSQAEALDETVKAVSEDLSSLLLSVPNVLSTPRPEPVGQVVSTPDGRLQAFSDGKSMWLRREGSENCCLLGMDGATAIGFSCPVSDTSPWLVLSSGNRIFAMQPEKPAEPICLSPEARRVKVGKVSDALLRCQHICQSVRLVMFTVPP